MSTINIILLILCALICIGAFILPPKKNRKMSDQTYVILVVVAVLLVFGSRCIEYVSVPGGVNQDEAMAAVDARALATVGTDRLGMVYPVHLQAWGFGQMSALLSYSMIPFISLLGFSTFSIRLPMLLFSLSGIAFVFFFCKDVFNRNVALIVLLLCAVNPWHIVQSRWSLDCNLFPHVLFGGLFLLAHGVLVPKRRFCLYLSMVLFGLSMYCYGISIYTVPLFLLLSCMCLLMLRRVTILEAGICAGIYLLIALPFILMILINTFHLDPIETPFFTIPYFSETIRKSDILFFSEAPGAQFLSNLTCLFKVIFQIGDDYLCNVVPGFSTLYVFSIPFGILGFIRVLTSTRKSVGSLLLMVFFFTAVFSGLITNNVNVNRENIIFYPLIIFDAVGVYLIVSKSRYLDVPVEIIYTIGFSLLCATYLTSYASAIALEFNEDFGQALCALEPRTEEPIFITPDVQAPGRSYVSEIYTLYYCGVDSQTYQSESFDEHYRFVNPTSFLISAYPGSQFVIPAASKDLFDSSQYEIRVFGRYACIKPSGADS